MRQTTNGTANHAVDYTEAQRERYRAIESAIFTLSEQCEVFQWAMDQLAETMDPKMQVRFASVAMLSIRTNARALGSESVELPTEPTTSAPTLGEAFNLVFRTEW